MIFENYNSILVISPHTDDGEFGCGGTLARLSKKNIEINYLVFSHCEESVPSGYPKDILAKEMREALNVLGIGENNIIEKLYPVRHFGSYRQQILEDLISIKNLIKPDLIFIPSVNDIHQDHQVIVNESLRAFKNSTIFCYELLWNLVSFRNQAFVKLEKEDVDIKIEAISKYKSQFFRKYSDPNFLEAQAIVRGVQGGYEYAEIFEVIRLMCK